MADRDHPLGAVAYPGAGVLRHMPECLALPASKRAALIDSSRLMQIAAGEALPDGVDVACLLSGRLAVLKPMPDGRGHIVGLPGAGAVLGWTAGAGNGAATNGYDITALEPCELALLDRGLFCDLLQALPDLEQRLIAQVLDEAEAARDWLRLIAQPRVTDRLAGFLMMLGRELMPGDGALHIPFRRADLASYLGTRKETLSRAFHQLEADGAIRILDPAAVQILQPALLEDMAGLDAEDPPAPI